jgi:hypothetical protein
MPDCLAEVELLGVESELCRSKNRPTWWTGIEEPLELAAVGRMLQEAIAIRNRVCRRMRSLDSENAIDLRMDQEKLLEAIPGEPPAASSFSRFLNGNPPKRKGTHDYVAIAKTCFQLILLWNRTIEELPEPSKRIFNRMNDFFFKNLGLRTPDDDGLCFFDPRFQANALPCRSIEASAELRSLAFESKHRNAKCRVTRVSGGLRFPHFDGNGLTETGDATIECLQSGVKIGIVVPRNNISEAATSATHFAEYVRCHHQDAEHNLRLVELEPGATLDGEDGRRWGGEYLSRYLRWAFYERIEPKDTAILLTARSRRNGPFAFVPDEVELRDFSVWADGFVWQ